MIRYQTVVALKLKIASIQQLLTPEDGQIDSNKVENKLASMEREFAEFKVQNANYTAVAGLVYDEGTEDTLFRDCYDARENLIDLYNDVFRQDAPAKVGPTTNDQYNWIHHKVQVLQAEIDERIQAVQAGINNDGEKTANKLAVYADKLENTQAKAESNLNVKYQKLYELKPTEAEANLQARKTWADMLRTELLKTKMDLATAKDTMLTL